MKGHVSYPYEDDFSLGRIKYWLNEIASGRIFPEGKALPKDINKFKALIKDSRSLMQSSMEDVALKQHEYDIVVLTYNSKNYEEHSY